MHVSRSKPKASTGPHLTRGKAGLVGIQLFKTFTQGNAGWHDFLSAQVWLTESLRGDSKRLPLGTSGHLE